MTTLVGRHPTVWLVLAALAAGGCSSMASAVRGIRNTDETGAVAPRFTDGTLVASTAANRTPESLQTGWRLYVFYKPT